MPAVSLPAAIANLLTGALPGLIEPKTTIKMIGKSSEKTTEVGLRKVASRLYLEIVKAALNCLAGLLISTNINAMRQYFAFPNQTIFLLRLYYTLAVCTN
jgi:hypothetical protein